MLVVLCLIVANPRLRQDVAINSLRGCSRFICCCVDEVVVLVARFHSTLLGNLRERWKITIAFPAIAPCAIWDVDSVYAVFEDAS